ncbi:ribose-phosphate diphosphokinase [Vulcanisaeta distributa]|uniref:ribose-phosphate diphosphokinase n=1 Tax=Vulcanisaeta distributa (strain DSM 14429 / JCM 11212 / NBRC 100878 / IC-017) TaxID=572478 RepID=E1QPJ5_VULDI|nr:ribose-phosphate diphosphokinase [Vulcanisaeta distributa]ADN50291.1 ribose-phosphate pyrophosphokinase [Vulcanisaeta distributa DSM 14429]
MAKYLVASFPWSSDMGNDVANALGLMHVVLETKQFPDGESYIRYPIDISTYDGLILIQRAYPEQNTRLIQAMLAIHAAHDLGVKRVHVILPYLPYSRQDRRFRDGEPVSLQTMLSLLSSLGASSIITVDVHKPEAFRVANTQCINIEPFKLYADRLRGIKDAVLLSPDIGSLWRVGKVSEYLGVSFSYLEKFRDRVTGEVTMKPKELDVAGKEVFIIDDIIATGGTIIEATKILRSLGAIRIHAIATHCLLLNMADSRMFDAGVSSITCSNTIPTRYSEVNVNQLIINVLKELVT